MLAGDKNLEDRILKGSVRRALDMLGDRWTMLILIGAFSGVRRFDGWKTQYGMSPSILSSRLKQLIKIGMMEKRSGDVSAQRQSYYLTEMGGRLFPWFLAVWNWENIWEYRDGDHPLRLKHIKCDHFSTVEFQCDHCTKRVGYENVIIKRGSGYDDVETHETIGSRRSGGSSNYVFNKKSIGRSIDMIGDRWSFLLISAAYFGVTRFDDFQEQLHIATNILSDRLQRLTDNGMLARNRYQEKPARYEYILTEKIISFYQVPLMLALWGDKWLPSPSGAPFVRVHDSCGKRLKVTPSCSHCGEELKQSEVQFDIESS